MMSSLLLATFLSLLPPAPTHPVCDAVYRRIEGLKDTSQRYNACNVLAWAAVWRGFDPALVVELAWGESGFKSQAVNKRSGCAGILQVAPRWWCTDRTPGKCNLQAAGFRALGHYLKKHPKDETTALCHFKSGEVCQPAGLKGAENTMRRVRRLRRQMRAAP